MDPCPTSDHANSSLRTQLARSGLLRHFESNRRSRTLFLLPDL